MKHVHARLGTHIEDHQVQDDEQQMDDNCKNALQFADHCLGVLELKGKMLPLLRIALPAKFHLQHHC